MNIIASIIIMSIISTKLLIHGIGQKRKYRYTDVLTKFDQYSHRICAKSCTRHSECNAINYNRDSLYCELLSTNETTDRIVNNEGFTYSDISDWAIENDACWPNPCPKNKKCVIAHTGPFCVTYDKYPVDCQAIGNKSSGVYRIYPSDIKGFNVYCNMDTEGGGWTAFQSRHDGSVDFYRTWTEYTNGFGNLNGEFWLGNIHLHELLIRHKYELYIQLEDFTGVTKYARYKSFNISDEASKFALTVGSYSGNAGDAMVVQNGQSFATKDRDNTGNCATLYKGSWWYNPAWCHYSNLNGLYLAGPHLSFADGVNWYQWKGYYYSLKRTQMMIRRQQT